MNEIKDGKINGYDIKSFFNYLPQEYKMIILGTHPLYNRMDYSNGTAWYEHTKLPGMRFKDSDEFDNIILGKYNEKE